MPKKILIVVTSHDQLGDTGHSTGYWLEELAVPYYAFIEAGHEVTIASPNGGAAPMDPGSAADAHRNETTDRFLADAAAQEKICHTVPLQQIAASDFDAVFYPGGHGPLWDLADNSRSIAIIETMFAADKPVAAVCHGPIVLANAKAPDGKALVAGRKVTGFSNSEEAAINLTEAVPNLVEDELRAKGGEYSRMADFEAHAVRDGRLITGQNPASSHAIAKLFLDALG